MKQPAWFLSIRCWIVAHLFDFYCKQNQFDRAMPVGVKWAELTEQIAGSDDPFTALAYARIADVCYEHKNCAEAERLYRYSIGLAEKSSATNKQDLAHTLNNLGALLGSQSKNFEALQCYERALDMATSVLDQSDPLMEKLRANIAAAERSNASATCEPEL